MRTSHAVSAALLGAVLALPAAAQNMSGAAAKGPQAVYVVDVGNQTGLLVGLDGLPPIVASASGAAKAPSGPMPGSPVPATLMLHAGVGLPAPFYQWVSAGTNGSAQRMTLGLRGVDTGGHYGEVALLSDASVSYVEVPALDILSAAPMSLGVKVQGVLRIEPPGKAPTLQQVSQLATRLAAVRWLVSGFHFAVGKLDTSGVRRVESFVVKPGGALTLNLTMNDPAAHAFATLAPKPPPGARPLVKQPPPPPVDAQLQLVTATGQVQAIIELHEMRVVSAQRGSAQDRATGAGVVANHVTVTAQQARLVFTPQIAQ